MRGADDRGEFRGEADQSLRLAYGELVERGVLEPLSADREDTRRWLDLDLASLIEGHYRKLVDVDSLSAEGRTDWVRRTMCPVASLQDPHSQYSKAYWLLDAGERVGTIALDILLPGGRLQRVSSLYVRPDRRRHGIARRALANVNDAALATGLRGLRIETNWTWPAAVQFYLHLGLWVLNWKDSLVFMWHDGLAVYRVDVAGRKATFLVQWEGDWHPLLEAENQGEYLGWTEFSAYQALREPLGEAYDLAPGTFALHLAVSGWPLKRSPELWANRYHWSDCGMPEGLACKIALFERIDRQQGYPVRTPRIPGLDYETNEER
jgi:GNAT superfamily N-acetyltransferase